MKFKQALLAFLLGLAATQVLACYTVYDRSGRMVYNDTKAPVDMSLPLHETMAARFPGGHLVFDTQVDCEAVTPLAPPAVARGGIPLLTDRRTAQAMKLPYTVLRGSIVVVQPPDARVGPGVSVIPAEKVSASPPSRDTVITELREPPMTIVQSADGTVTSELSRR
jgi:hypothetical protein